MQLPAQHPKPLLQASPRNPQHESPSQLPLQQSLALLQVQYAPAGRHTLPCAPVAPEPPASEFPEPDRPPEPDHPPEPELGVTPPAPPLPAPPSPSVGPASVPESPLAPASMGAASRPPQPNITSDILMLKTRKACMCLAMVPWLHVTVRRGHEQVCR